MKVLLASDSSQHSRAAADYLLSLPFRKPIDLDIVSAVAPPTAMESGTMGIPADLSTFIKLECDSAKTRVAELSEKLGGPVHSTHTHVPVGSPSTELITVAEQCHSDLIVLGLNQASIELRMF